MKTTIQIKNCQNKDCGDSFDGTTWWGSRESIKAGEDKRVRDRPVILSIAAPVKLRKAA